MALNIKSLFSLGHPRPRKLSNYILSAPLAPPTDTQTYDCVKQPVDQHPKKKEEEAAQEAATTPQKPSSREVVAQMLKKLNVI
ncbi:MAG: hypothetical protein J6Y94_05085 [Bacteriovoracaceae bacterium]|nr:hypothetical protein [Bacteriovoracaceae bacterium]